MGHLRITWATRPFFTYSASFLLCAPLAEGGFSSVGNLDPLGVRRGRAVVVIVPVPPLVRPALGGAVRRVFPSFLTAQRREVEVAPDAAHGFIGAVVDEVSPKHFVAIAEENVVAVPFIDAKVFVEAVDDGVPGHVPFHPRFEASDVLLRRARGVGESSVAGVEMGEMRDLVSPQGAAAARMFRPAENAGLEEGAV